MTTHVNGTAEVGHFTTVRLGSHRTWAPGGPSSRPAGTTPLPAPSPPPRPPAARPVQSIGHRQERHKPHPQKPMPDAQQCQPMSSRSYTILGADADIRTLTVRLTLGLRVPMRTFASVSLKFRSYSTSDRQGRSFAGVLNAPHDEFLHQICSMFCDLSLIRSVFFYRAGTRKCDGR